MTNTLTGTITLTRYIAIEHNSGYIWGDATSETPEEACAAIDRDADWSKAVAWERVSPIRDTDGGYHVYEASAGLPDIEDGQDQEMIDRVIAECRHIGDYRPVAEVEES
jgi:hypothetical protein